MIEEHDAERLLAAVGAVRRGVRRSLGSPFADGALTGAQVELVRLLRREPGIGVADAARSLGVAPNTVSTLVSRLTEAGFVRRETDPADARAARLQLTEYADGVLRDRRDRRTAAVAEVLAELPAGQRGDVDRAIALLAALADGLARHRAGDIEGGDIEGGGGATADVAAAEAGARAAPSASMTATAPRRGTR